MRFSQRNLALVMTLVFLLISTLFTGCGDKSSQQGKSEETAGSGQETTAVETESDVKETKEAETEAATKNYDPVSLDIFAMDTYMTVTVWGEEANEACQAAEKEINRIDAMVSTGSEDSEITKLNQSGSGEVSEGTAYMIEKSVELYESTGGLFDISIYPVMRAWGFTDQNYEVPKKKVLTELLSHVRADAVLYDEESKTVSFDDSAVEIDLGGIAKGYTSDRVIEVINSYDIECALINLGGNVKTLNPKLTGEEWRIAIQDPEDSNAMAGVITCCDKAVITSGGYQRYFEEDGTTYHHIIDPRTGYPASSGLISVSIVSADGTLADGLSTSLFIMGLDEAHAYWQEHKDEFDAVMIDESGKIYVTAGLKDRFWSEREWEVLE